MRLIDADALLEQMKHRKEYVGRPSDPVCLVEDAPTIPAVPLDKLCEWLAERYEPPYALIDIDKLRRPIDYRQQKEIWMAALTKWMEEQDAAD